MDVELFQMNEAKVEAKELSKYWCDVYRKKKSGGLESVFDQCCGFFLSWLQNFFFPFFFLIK